MTLCGLIDGTQVTTSFVCITIRPVEAGCFVTHWIDEITGMKIGTCQLMRQQLTYVVENETANSNGIVKVFVEVTTHKTLNLSDFVTLDPDVALHCQVFEQAFVQAFV